EHEEFEWELVNGKRRARIKLSGAVSASDLNTVHEMAMRGQGIAFAMESFYSEAASTAGLQRVLPAWSSDRWPGHAVYSSRKFLPLRLQLFLRQLQAWKNPDWRSER